MKRLWIAIGVGIALVAVLFAVGRLNIATPLPFWLLSPGIAIGIFMPDSHFDPEGGDNAGPVSMIVMFVVNTAVYSGLIYLLLGLFARRKANEA